MDFIVRETCSEIRALARMSLRDNWKKVAVVMAIYYILTITLPAMVNVLIPGASIEQYNAVLEETTNYPLIAILYSVFFAGVFEVGLFSFLLYFVRRKESNAAHLFDGFEHILKAFWLSIRMGFFVFLWSLLLLIPGVIAAIRYSQSYVILADHPEYSAAQCMGVSKQYMKQNKGKYFCLILSFIGWGLLAALPGLFVPATLSGIPYLLVDLVVCIPYFFFLAYINTAQVVFYELVSKNLVAAPKTESTEEFDF